MAGPGGALWFTEFNGNKIGRITTAGVITNEYPTLAAGTPFGIAAGPDGNLWFTKINGNRIGRITTAGVITEFTIPTANANAAGITAGPDGALWFVESGANKIGRITTAGVVTNEFSIPTANSNSFAITTGPDGNLWFTEQGASNIGRITTGGTVSEFPTPTPSQGGFITAGPDDALWFTEFSAPAFNRIGRITTGAGQLFVTNFNNNSVTVYTRTANGDVGPLRTLAGAATNLNRPIGLALDAVNNELFVVNNSSPNFFVTVYARAASGNAAPLRTLVGPSTGLDNPTGSGAFFRRRAVWHADGCRVVHVHGHGSGRE